MRIAVFGASGFIGGHLTAALRARGDDVHAGSLRDPAAAAHLADGCDVVVNLSGEPIGQRWNAAVKRAIGESRVELPRRFIEALAAAKHLPRAYISASAVGYYGSSERRTFTESSPPGSDFLADVCVRWEREADLAGALGMRVAKIRTALALGNGGALAKIVPPFRLGLGGIIGSGRQWFPWIHIDDLVGIYLLAIDGADGVLNAVAPNPVTNAQFTHALGRALHRPTIVTTPTFALRTMLGEGADVVLTGQRVLPERTLALGYRFVYETIDDALHAILGD